MMQAHDMIVGQNAKDSPRIIAEATVAQAITMIGLGTGCRVNDGERNNEAAKKQKKPRKATWLKYWFVWFHHLSPSSRTIPEMRVSVNG